MVKISDIAIALGISSATVSNALTDKGRMKESTRNAIKEKAREMGYTVVPQYKRQIKKIVILAEQGSIPFCSETIRGIMLAANENDVFPPLYDMSIISKGIPRDADTAKLRPIIDSILNTLPYQPSGLIYISQYPRKIPKLFLGYSFPIVEVYSTDSGADVSIDYDNQSGAYEATRALIGGGCKNIAMLSGPVDTTAVNERMIGYQRALIDSGLVFHPKMVWIGDWEVSSGKELTKNLLDSSTPPDGIFAQNDTMAFGAILAAKEAGLRVPEDFSVIGFDNSEFCKFTNPSISSIGPQFESMGKEAYAKLTSCLNGKAQKQRHIFVPCKLVKRESSR